MLEPGWHVGRIAPGLRAVHAEMELFDGFMEEGLSRGETPTSIEGEGKGEEQILGVCAVGLRR